jgi:hypothetical protein
VAAPAFDLTLTDSRGELISRRVAQMVDFGPALTRVPAAANLPLQTVLGGSERPISGYTIEIFYP